MNLENLQAQMKNKASQLSIKDLQNLLVDIIKNEKWDLLALHNVALEVLDEKMECQEFVEFCGVLETI
jgi:hypothetical protein